MRTSVFFVAMMLAGGACYTGGGEDNADFRAGTQVVHNAAQLQQAIEQLSSGGSIRLASDGDYGHLDLQGMHFAEPTKIFAKTGVQARFDTVSVVDCTNVRLTGLHVRPSSKTVAVTIVDGDRVHISDSDIGFADHALDWSANDWKNTVSHGITETGSSQTVLYRNAIHHVRNGIVTDGYATDVHRNRINFFADDGVRVHGDDAKVRRNLITNNVKIDGSTNVGIQSVSVGANGVAGAGTVDGMLIWGNSIIESTVPNKAHAAPLQGVGFFDGTYSNLQISQNVVFTDAWTGIAVRGGDNAIIKYNTVLDSDPTSSRRPSVRIFNHKNGSQSINARVRFNIAAREDSAGYVNVNNNLVVDAADYGTYVDGLSNYDFTLSPSTPAKRGAVHFAAISGTLGQAGQRHGVTMGAGLINGSCSVGATDERCTVVAEEYDRLIPTNALKWHATRQQQGAFSFANADPLIAFADDNGLEVHGHVLLWNVGNPAWLEQYRYDGAALSSLMTEHIQQMVGHFETTHPGTITSWDVVNEPLYSSGVLKKPEHFIWAAVGADVGPSEYIKQAFELAHAANPSAHLVLNDFRIETGPKADAMFALVSALRADGVPVHGVGFQSHFDTDWTYAPTQAQIQARMQQYAAIGVDVHITELDARIPEPVTEAKLAQAHAHYQRVTQACFIEPNCVSVTTWGLDTGASSWIHNLGGYAPVLPFDDTVRRALPYWILRAGQ